MAFRPTRTGNAGPGPARDRNRGGQRAMIEEQAQRSAFGLQGVGTLRLGEPLLEIGRREFVGAGVKLREADRVVRRPGPLHEPDDMFLVGAARFERVNHPS